MNCSFRRTARPTSTFLAALLIATISARPTAASDKNWILTTGAKVRLSTLDDGRKTVGALVSLDQESVSLRLKDGPVVRIERRNLASVEVSAGVHRRTLGGALMGTVIGAGIGAILPVDDCAPGPDNFTRFGTAGFACSRGESIGTMAAGFGVWGTFFGYRTKADDWRPVSMTEVALGRPDPDFTGPPAAPAPPAPAVSALPLRPDTPLVGKRVRVTHQSQVTTGVVMSVSQNQMFVSGQEGTEVVSLGEINRVEMFRREKRQTLKGVLMGGVIGFALDFADEPYCVDGSAGPYDCSRLSSASQTAVGGAAMGAVIGFLVKKSEWRTVRLEEELAKRANGDGTTLRISPIIGQRELGMQARIGW